MRFLIFGLSLICFLSSSAIEIENKDSLKQVLKKTYDEQKKLNIYFDLIKLSESETELSKWYYKATAVSRKISDSLRIKTEQITADTYSGNFQNDEQALYHNLEALKIAESINDSAMISNINYSIGFIYFWRNDLDKCKKFVEQSLKTYPSTSDILGKARTMMALGVILQNDSTKNEESLYYQTQAIKIKKENNAWHQVPISLNNLAELHAQMGDTVKAIQTLEQSVIIADTTGAESSAIYATFILGYYQSAKGDYQKGIPNIKKAITWWTQKKTYQKDLPRAYNILANAYRGAGNYKEATAALDSLVKFNKEIYEENKLSKIQEMDTKYQTEKKELELDQQKKQNQLAKKETELVEKEKEFQIYIFLIIAFFLIINIVYFFFRYKKQKKDKELISFQKEEITQRSKEIEDSITYAERIQSALLPPTKNLKSLFTDSFILFKPKDIVAGDFYFLEKNPKNRSIFLSVADCTGHGVPGAMVSVVGINGLKRCIKEFQLNETGEILNALTKQVTETFEESGEKIQDGMDLALIKITPSEEDFATVEFSGANNPLWISVPNQKIDVLQETSGTDKKLVPQIEGEHYTLYEIKGDKQPIGFYTEKRAFQTNTLKIPKGARIYASTDGYQDQFGGEKFSTNKTGGKKFKAKNLKKLILDSQQLSLTEQNALLEKTFYEWKGDLEQVDDVCMIGIEL